MPPATGRFVLRLAPSLHSRLRAEAARRGLSLNSLCAEVLDAGTRIGAGDGASRWAPWTDKARRLYGSGLVGLVLFGSVARGESRESSDTDLLMALTPDVHITRDLYRTWDGQDPLDDAVSPHFVHVPQAGVWPGSLWLEVAMDGVVIYDPSGSLMRALVAIRTTVALGQARMGLAHGHRYWIDEARRRHAERDPVA